MHQSSQKPDIPPQIAFVLMTMLLFGAWFLRVDNITQIPPGIESDTAHVLFDALRISRGYPQPFYFDTRPEPAWRFIMGGWFVLVGPEVWTARLPAAFVGLLTIAMVYRIGLVILRKQAWKYLGALVAAGAMTGITAHLFLSRSHYRVILTPFILTLAMYCLLRAAHTQGSKTWSLGGFFAGLGMHTYIAGLMVPLLAVGFGVHQFVFPPKGERARWFNPLYMLGGMIIPVGAWLLLRSYIPDLYARVDAVSGNSVSFPPSFERIWEALVEAFPAFFLEGYPHALYNTPDTPFLNPVLAVFAVIGFGAAVWRWRHADGAILLGALFLFMLPGGLSREATHSVRLLGTFPVLALLAGWGVASTTALITEVVGRRHIAQVITVPAATFLGVCLAGYSLIYAHTHYQNFFRDRDQYAGFPVEEWRKISHNYTLALYDAMLLLEDVTEPTYVPYTPLNTPIGAYMLQRRAYPNVMTWARYSEEHNVDMLPAGQVFYPTYNMYYRAVPHQDSLQVLLLPDEKTMVLLPPNADGSPVIEWPTDDDAEDLYSPYGWHIAKTDERDASAPPELALDAVTDATFTIGNGMHLVGHFAPQSPEPGTEEHVVLMWEISSRQPAAMFSIVQLANLVDWNPVGLEKDLIHQYVFPTSYWQPGDIVPEVVEVDISAGLSDGLYAWGVGGSVPPSRELLPVTPVELGQGPIANMWFWQTARYPQVVTGKPLPNGAQTIDASFDDGIALEGYEVRREEEQSIITLYWRAYEPPTDDYTIFVHAEAGGQIIAQRDERPLGGTLPTWAWQADELVVTTFMLDAPQPEDIFIGMYNSALQRLPVEVGGTPAEENRVQLATEYP